MQISPFVDRGGQSDVKGKRFVVGRLLGGRLGDGTGAEKECRKKCMNQMLPRSDYPAPEGKSR